jgi:hypothetical protein
MMKEVFTFSYLGYGHEKHKKIQLSMLIHGSRIVRVYFEKGSKDEEKDWCQ